MKVGFRLLEFEVLILLGVQPFLKLLCSVRSCRLLGLGQQSRQVVIHARCLEVRFFLKGLTDITDIDPVAINQANGEIELIGLVQRCEDLVLGDRDGLCPHHAALDLDEPQGARAGDGRLHVVSEILVAHVPGNVPQLPLRLHDGIHREHFGAFRVLGEGRNGG